MNDKQKRIKKTEVLKVRYNQLYSP